MNELYILNVGRADCIVMLLDTPQGRKCIVMDAGSCTYQGKTPLLTLRSKGICEVDLAILTHLHQDHFGGFHQLIGQIPIKKLLTPCGDLVFTKRIYPLFGDREYYREYHQIFSYLADCGTALCFPRTILGELLSMEIAGCNAYLPRCPVQWNLSFARNCYAVPV